MAATIPYARCGTEFVNQSSADHVQLDSVVRSSAGGSLGFRAADAEEAV
jgi:hypothetical protein